MGRGPTISYHKSIHDCYVEGTLTCLKPEYIQQNISTDFPLILNIEPTNACNLRCVCCPREKMVARNGVHYLSIEDFKLIIDEATRYQQLVMLNLHKDGEPLLHKKLPEMVAYAKKKKVARTIHLNTNGTLLHTRTAKGILEAGIDDITISIDAAFPDTYFKLKKSKAFESLINKIENFITYRNQIGSHAIIRVKIMEFDLVTPFEIKAFHDKWSGVADQVQVTGIHNWSGAIDDLTITDETSHVRFPCALLWYALAVNSNGAVSICNVDWDYSGVVGNIHENDIHAIWNNNILKKIRQAHLSCRWDFISVCNSCVVWCGTGDIGPHLQTRKDFFSEVISDSIERPS